MVSLLSTRMLEWDGPWINVVHLRSDMDLLHKTWNIPKEQMYVTLTEHKGEDFHLLEKYLASWKAGEVMIKMLLCGFIPIVTGK